MSDDEYGYMAADERGGGRRYGEPAEEPEE